MEPEAVERSEGAEDTSPKVSVVIPTYNSADFLMEAVDSVLNQTWRDLEIIVVDDGSTDGTQDIVGRYGDRVRHVYKKNEGPSSARNMGIRMARGTYVAFLDSDDVWEPEKLRIQMDFMEGHPEIVLVCMDSRIIGFREQRERKLKRDFIGNLFPLLYSKSFITTSSVLMIKDCFREIGYFNEELRTAEDYDVWLRVARQYPIAYLDQPLVGCRKHHDNVSRDKITLRQNALSVLEAHYDPREISARTYRIRVSNLHLYFGRAYLRLGDIAMARKAFGRSLRLTPFRLRSIRYWLKARLMAQQKQ